MISSTSKSAINRYLDDMSDFQKSVTIEPGLPYLQFIKTTSRQ